METIAYKLPCFCLSYDVWCDQINQCIDEINLNNFKSHGAIFVIFLPPKTPYFLERTHKILTQRTSPAARCRPLARSVKTALCHERYHNVVMWHLILYKWRRSNKMLRFRRTFFNLLDFTVSLSYRDWHSETPWSDSSNQIGTYCQAQDFLLRTNYTLEM